MIRRQVRSTEDRQLGSLAEEAWRKGLAVLRKEIWRLPSRVLRCTPMARCQTYRSIGPKNGYVNIRSLTNVRCVRCRARQLGAPPPTCGRGFINQMLGQLARDQAPLRRSLSGRAPSDYGRALATKRRRVDRTSNARVIVRSISMKPPRGRWCMIVFES